MTTAPPTADAVPEATPDRGGGRAGARPGDRISRRRERRRAARAGPAPADPSAVLGPRTSAFVRRRQAVEYVLRRGLWSMRAAMAIAREHRVSERQVWRDRSAVLEEWREDLAARDVRADKAELLARSRELAARAADANNFMAAARLLDFEARVLGAFEPLRIGLEVSADDPVALAQTIVREYPRACAVLGLDPDDGPAVIDVLPNPEVTP